jgi:hypothetical protein
VGFEINLIVGDLLDYPPPASKVSKFAPPVGARRRESLKHVSTLVRAINLLIITLSSYLQFTTNVIVLKRYLNFVNKNFGFALI